MRSIEAIFRKISRGKVNKDLSSYACLGLTVKGRGYGERTIQRSFKKFVHRDDYDPKDTKALIGHLMKLTNMPEEFILEGTKLSREERSALRRWKEWNRQ